jgi:uncharacterized membrane protein
MSGEIETARSAWPDRPFWRGFWWRAGIGFLATFAVLALWVATMPPAKRDAVLTYWSNVRVPAPSFRPELLLAVPLSVQLHVAAITLAFVVGAVIFSLPKGTGFHRLLGWTWVSSMIVVAGTSVAMIADFNNGINALHIFTVVTVVSLWAALTGIRAGNVRRHAASMTGLYVGGMFVAGLFAFIPGRLMWQVFFGE